MTQGPWSQFDINNGLIVSQTEGQPDGGTPEERPVGGARQAQVDPSETNQELQPDSE